MALETAKRLATRGIDLWLVARGENALEKAKEEILEQAQVEIRTTSLDLYDRNAVEAFIGDLKGEEHHLRYLVNAAGYFKPVSFLDHSREDYHAMMDVNESFFFIS